VRVIKVMAAACWPKKPLQVREEVNSGVEATCMFSEQRRAVCACSCMSCLLLIRQHAFEGEQQHGLRSCIYRWLQDVQANCKP
jgi:hypothetical protein